MTLPPPRHAKAPRSSASPMSPPGPDAAWQMLLQMQQFQWAAFTAWQRMGVAVSNELWDEWRSHFGGGVPIDG